MSEDPVLDRARIETSSGSSDGSGAEPQSASPLVGGLPPGPLDIIADVHGEYDALVRLLTRLGCDVDTATVERPLVFLGDLVDRGPDSPAVLRLVRYLCDAGVATMVLGNHEVNLLRDDPKEGNGWWFGHDDQVHFDGERRSFPSAVISASEQAEFRWWLSMQPLVRQRSDLRVVHACWHPDLIAGLGTEDDAASAAAAFDRQLRVDFEQRGDWERCTEERARYGGLTDRDLEPRELLEYEAAFVVAEHLHNPVRGLTCGLEHAVPLEGYKFIGGKWRTTARSPWWNDYHEEAAVVVGHYWRRRAKLELDKPNLWSDLPPFGWAGPRGNVFCLDYSVGRRFRERWSNRGATTGFKTGLAAMRWPEQTLVFDDERAPIRTTGFGSNRQT